jgi:hypothetical protein
MPFCQRFTQDGLHCNIFLPYKCSTLVYTVYCFMKYFHCINKLKVSYLPGHILVNMIWFGDINQWYVKIRSWHLFTLSRRVGLSRSWTLGRVRRQVGLRDICHGALGLRPLFPVDSLFNQWRKEINILGSLWVRLRDIPVFCRLAAPLPSSPTSLNPIRNQEEGQKELQKEAGDWEGQVTSCRWKVIYLSHSGWLSEGTVQKSHAPICSFIHFPSSHPLFSFFVHRVFNFFVSFPFPIPLWLSFQWHGSRPRIAFCISCAWQNLIRTFTWTQSRADQSIRTIQKELNSEINPYITQYQIFYVRCV